MDFKNFLTEEETLDQAYDIFLELAADNLTPADSLLFNLQFEERGAAELIDPAADWQEQVNVDLNINSYAEVVIGLTDQTTEQEGEFGEITDIFARILICRQKAHKFCHILWKS